MGFRAGGPLVRFWRMVEKTDTCWNWTGCHRDDGYGYFHVWKGIHERAHVFSYQIAKGLVPKGLELDYLCRNRGCVNPDHLEAVTRRENLMRSPIAMPAINARKKTCPKGHPYGHAREQERLRYQKRRGEIA
jgi:hypothetical protein